MYILLDLASFSKYCLWDSSMSFYVLVHSFYYCIAVNCVNIPMNIWVISRFGLGGFFLGGGVCLFVLLLWIKLLWMFSYMSFWIYALNSLCLLLNTLTCKDVSTCYVFSCRYYLLAFHYGKWFFSIPNTHSTPWHTFVVSTTPPFQCNIIWIR